MKAIGPAPDSGAGPRASAEVVLGDVGYRRRKEAWVVDRWAREIEQTDNCVPSLSVFQHLEE